MLTPHQNPNLKPSTLVDKDGLNKEQRLAVTESDRILQEAIDGKRTLKRGKISINKK